MRRQGSRPRAHARQRSLGVPGVRVQNSKVDFVEIVTYYSNTPELLSDLRRTVEAVTMIMVEQDEPDVSIAAPVDRNWRVRDRLTSTDIDQIVESFQEGTTIPELVTRYGISRSSVKKLLRRRGIRRSPRPAASS